MGMVRFLVLLLIAGCSYTGYQPEYDSLMDRLEKDPAFVPGTDMPKGEPLPDLSGVVELEEFVRFALARNPNLRAAMKRLEAAIEEIPQAASAPDPELEFELSFTAAGFFDKIVEYSIELMQEILFPGKLENRARYAIEAAAVASEKGRELALRLRLDVAQAYAMLYHLDRALELDHTNKKLLDQVRKVAQARYEAGEVPQQDVLKVRVRAQQLEHHIIQILRQRKDQEARLNALLGRRDRKKIGSPVIPEKPSDPEKLPVLLQRAFERRPDVAAMSHRIRRALAGVKLAELDWYPNITPWGEYEARRRGEDEINLAVAIHLSFLRPTKREAAVRQTKAILGEAAYTYEAKLNEIARDATSAHAGVIQTRDSLKLFKDKLVPDSKKTYASALAAYSTATVDFGTLLDALVSAQEIEEQYYRLMGDHLTARERLRRVVGDSP